MTSSLFSPPERLTDYHLGPLLRAEHEPIPYRPDLYPLHSVSPSVVRCVWNGLLADAAEGVVLSDLGRRMLADWHASPAGQQWAAEWAEEEQRIAREAEGRARSGEQQPGPQPTAEPEPEQLDLLAGSAS